MIDVAVRRLRAGRARSRARRTRETRGSISRPARAAVLEPGARATIADRASPSRSPRGTPASSSRARGSRRATGSASSTPRASSTPAIAARSASSSSTPIASDAVRGRAGHAHRAARHRARRDRPARRGRRARGERARRARGFGSSSQLTRASRGFACRRSSAGADAILLLRHEKRGERGVAASRAAACRRARASCARSGASCGRRPVSSRTGSRCRSRARSRSSTRSRPDERRTASTSSTSSSRRTCPGRSRTSSSQDDAVRGHRAFRARGARLDHAPSADPALPAALAAGRSGGLPRRDVGAVAPRAIGSTLLRDGSATIRMPPVRLSSLRSQRVVGWGAPRDTALLAASAARSCPLRRDAERLAPRARPASGVELRRLARSPRAPAPARAASRRATGSAEAAGRGGTFRSRARAGIPRTPTSPSFPNPWTTRPSGSAPASSSVRPAWFSKPASWMPHARVELALEQDVADHARRRRRRSRARRGPRPA